MATLKSSLKKATSTLKKATSTARSTATKTASTLKTTASKARTTATKAASTLRTTASKARTTATKTASTLKTVAAKTKTTTSRAATALKSTTTTARKAATNLTKTIRSTASKTSNLGKTVKSTINSGTSTIKSLATKITGTSKTKASNLSNTFRTLTNSVKSNNVLSSINSAVKARKNGSISSLTNLVTKYAGQKTNDLTNSFKTIKDNITSKTTSIKNGLLTTINRTYNNRSKINVSEAINALRKTTKINTKNALSNLFKKTGSLRTSLVSSIKPLSVFSGLNNRISDVKNNIKNGLNNITNVDTMGVLGLSTTLGGAAQRIHNSFETWKGRITNLVAGGSMSGIIDGNIGEAKTRMEELFGNFQAYAKQMAHKLFGISEEAERVDEMLATSSSSSGYDDGPGVLGAFDDLDEVSVMTAELTPMAAGPATSGERIEMSLDSDSNDILQLAKDVMNGKYGVGAERKQLLGDKYQAVQDLVNEYSRTHVWPSVSSSTDKATNMPYTDTNKTTTKGNATSMLSSVNDVENFVSNDVPKSELKSGDNPRKACSKYARLRADYYYKQKYGVSEVFSKDHPVRSDAYADYFRNKKGYSVSSTPQEGAIIAYGNGYNHTAFVEKVNSDGSIVITESNWDMADGRGHNYQCKTLTPYQYETKYGAEFITYDPANA